MPTGCCCGNAVVESFFATLKKDLVYRSAWLGFNEPGLRYRLVAYRANVGIAMVNGIEPGEHVDLRLLQTAELTLTLPEPCGAEVRVLEECRDWRSGSLGN
jgi:hypothetical protein